MPGDRSVSSDDPPRGPPAATGGAATGGVIRGVVEAAGGVSATNVAVRVVESPVPMPDVALRTDRDGRFELPVPGPGRYRLACRLPDGTDAGAAVDLAGDAAEVRLTAGDHTDHD